MIYENVGGSKVQVNSIFKTVVGINKKIKCRYENVKSINKEVFIGNINFVKGASIFERYGCFPYIPTYYPTYTGLAPTVSISNGMVVNLPTAQRMGLVAFTRRINLKKYKNLKVVVNAYTETPTRSDNDSRLEILLLNDIKNMYDCLYSQRIQINGTGTFNLNVSNFDFDCYLGFMAYTTIRYTNSSVKVTMNDIELTC